MCSHVDQVAIAIDIIKNSSNMIYEDNNLLKTHKKSKNKKTLSWGKMINF